MNIYIIICLVTLILAAISNVKYKGVKIFKFNRVIVFMMLFIISAFRFNVGTDYNAYLESYKYVLNTGWYNNSFEIGFRYLMKILSSISNNEQLIFIATSLIILALIFITINKYSKRFELSCYLFICLYFYTNSFNILRQYIAIAIVFYSLKYILNRNLKKFLLMIMLATLFHKTAIICVVLYFLKDIKIRLKYIVYSCILSIVAIPFVPYILNVVGKIFKKYSVYLNYENGTGFGVTSIIMLFIIFGGVMLHKKLVKDSELNNFYINCILVAFIFQNLSVANSLFSRISSYFYIFSILLIPEFVCKVNKNLKIPLYIVITSIGMIWFTFLLSNNMAGVVPYKFRIL